MRHGENILKSLYHTLDLPVDVYIMEIFLIGASFWWGIVLLYPFGTFSFGNNANFALMASVANNTAWGCLVTFISGWLFVSIIMHWLFLRRVILLLHVAWWFMIAYMTTRGTAPLTGLGVYGLMGLFALYSAIFPKVHQPYVEEYFRQHDVMTTTTFDCQDKD